MVAGRGGRSTEKSVVRYFFRRERLVTGARGEDGWWPTQVKNELK